MPLPAGATLQRKTLTYTMERFHFWTTKTLGVEMSVDWSTMGHAENAHSDAAGKRAEGSISRDGLPARVPLPKWHLATYVLLGAGAAEVATGFANRANFLSLILGAATLAVGVITYRRGCRWDAGTWVVATLGACLAFRVLVYQAPPLALVAVAASGALYVASVFLGFSAWRADVQAMAAAARRR